MMFALSSHLAYIILYVYRYYSGKLTNSKTISKLVVWEQGKGIINNLGALRTKPFSEWGMYNNQTHTIYNWDGTVSPVAHQWDRDANLHNYYKLQHKNWEKEFESSQEHKNKKNLRGVDNNNGEGKKVK